MGDLSVYKTKVHLMDGLKAAHPQDQVAMLRNFGGQLWAFAKRIEVGDLVVLPLKGADAVAIGKVTGEYEYRLDNPPGAKHARPVEWLHSVMPRSRFDQDLLYSFGAFMTFARSNATTRRTGYERSWRPSQLRCERSIVTPQGPEPPISPG